MEPTYIWMAIFTVSAVMFFGVGLWVMIRGGKDVLEMLTEAYTNRRDGKCK